jgi:hypothetical protein
LGKCPGGPKFNIVYNEENLKKNVLETRCNGEIKIQYSKEPDMEI